MITYIKLGKVRGISIEWIKKFGMAPFFQKNSFHHETIFDIPYGQIIFTSGRWIPKNRGAKKPDDVKTMPLRRASNVNRQDNTITKRIGRVDRN